MRLTLCALAVFLAVPAYSQGITDVQRQVQGPDWKPYPETGNPQQRCKMLGVGIDGGTRLSDCAKPSPGTPGAQALEKAKPYPWIAQNEVYNRERAKAAEDLKRRLHEENVERWSPPVPKRERGI